MKIITFEDIKKLDISAEQCFYWVNEMIQNKSKAILPAKISMKPDQDVFCNVMPSIIRDEDYYFGGVKVVTRYPERIPSLDSNLMLFDAKSGKMLALMDANWITAMRTGAVATHSIMLLAKKDFKNIGIIGLGNTARATILILASMAENREFNIKLLKYKGQEDLFIKRFENFKNLHFNVVDSNSEVVKGSDVVISAATYLSEDICTDDCFDEGVLVVPIHTRGFSNCDLFFDKVYADDLGHVCHFKYFDKFKYFAEVSDVVNKKAIGRVNNKERIIAYNIGVSMHDVNFAHNIYRQLVERDIQCQNIDMRAPTDKFWI